MRDGQARRQVLVARPTTRPRRAVDRAGLRAKRIQTLMGHASVAMTFDRYGYLFEAREADEQAMGAIAAQADRLLGQNANSRCIRVACNFW